MLVKLGIFKMLVIWKLVSFLSVTVGLWVTLLCIYKYFSWSHKNYFFLEAFCYMRYLHLRFKYIHSQDLQNHTIEWQCYTFRGVIPAILHLLLFGRSSEFMSFRRNVVLSAYTVYKHSLLDTLKLVYFYLILS